MGFIPKASELGMTQDEFDAKKLNPKTCNRCGKVFDEWDIAENFGLHYRIGYGSKYDEHQLDLNLCCACFDGLLDNLIPQCKINPLTDMG